MRVKQQTLDSMDEIIASVNTPFKLSRSDLGRAYIEQGIERHYGRGPKDEGMFSLADRLNIFFQLCVLLRMECLKDGRSVNTINPNYGYNNRFPSTVTTEALVRQVYLQRMTWFFELDAVHLKAINPNLGQDTIVSLMNPQSSSVICNTLDSVIALRDMFSNISMVLTAAEKKVNEWDDQKTREVLARIEGYAKDNGLPFTFKGYPDTEYYALQIEMWSLLNWIDNGQGDHRIGNYGLLSDEDLTDKYAVMLEVYQNIHSNKQFDLNALEQMVKSRQFHMI
ncbi:hypothetical protein [Pantoea sp. RSPAM1]|uniref:hypothetical protein n=1 Tax=Pantoea sp. RSPAM1 TaxID=2675223 RepID=UPI00315CB210